MTKKIIVASHRRSGTHLTIDAIANNFRTYSKTPSISSVTLDHLSAINQWELTPVELKSRIENVPSILKTHSHGIVHDFFIGDMNLKGFIQQIFDEAKIIYVHRDGRDVMVSLYHYERNFNQVAKEQSFTEYLRASNSFDVPTYQNEMDRVEYWRFHINSWIKKENILVVSYDDLQNEYAASLQKIAAFIEEPLEQDIRDVRRRANGNYYISKIKRRLLKQAGNVRYSSVGFRKGVSGDWKEHFSEEDLSFFAEKGGELNRRLGYR